MGIPISHPIKYSTLPWMFRFIAKTSCVETSTVNNPSFGVYSRCDEAPAEAGVHAVRAKWIRYCPYTSSLNGRTGAAKFSFSVRAE